MDKLKNYNNFINEGVSSTINKQPENKSLTYFYQEVKDFLDPTVESGLQYLDAAQTLLNKVRASLLLQVYEIREPLDKSEVKKIDGYVGDVEKIFNGLDKIISKYLY